MGFGDEKETKSSYKQYCFAKCFHSWQDEPENEKKQANVSKTSTQDQKTPGGWKAMPFILGNETFERLASFGLLANFLVYLMRVYHLEQVAASNVLNIWSGLNNFAPLLGAFLSDSYFGRFKTIAFSSCAAFLGMMTITLTAALPYLHPSKCNQGNPCEKATTLQMLVLVLGLGLLSVGTGGIRPCSIPFGVDQFDQTTEKGRNGISSYYNWYYTTFTLVLMISITVVVYIQDQVSWILGFGLPTGLMAFSILLFFVGSRVYIHVKPDGSIFSGIGHVLVAAYKKRGLKLPEGGETDGVFYDPPVKGNVLIKLPLTEKYSFLNKAAVIMKDDMTPDGSGINHWRLVSIQHVEEVKCLIKVCPIWASGIISLTTLTQQWTFTVSQALKMERHLGPNFEIPASSIAVISMITVGFWLPFYDRIVVLNLRKITKQEGGITLLQKIGVGAVLSVLAMVVAGVVERKRREAANSNGTVLSVFWLAPQFVVMGFCEAFSGTGQIEFYNRQFPDHMRSLANALFFCSFAGASYVSALLVTLVNKYSRTKDHPSWLDNDLNAGRLDYFYFLLAGMGFLNLFYFVFCARRYQYKAVNVPVEDKSSQDIELSSGKLSS